MIDSEDARTRTCRSLLMTEVAPLDYHASIKQYYRGFKDRDRAMIQAVLAPDFRFVSSFGEFNGRDAMLDAIWPSVGQTWATNLRIFGEGPEFVVLYEHANAVGAQPAMTMAEHFKFDGDHVAMIEVFVGWPLQTP